MSLFLGVIFYILGHWFGQLIVIVLPLRIFHYLHDTKQITTQIISSFLVLIILVAAYSVTDTIWWMSDIAALQTLGCEICFSMLGIIAGSFVVGNFNFPSGIEQENWLSNFYA